MSEWQVTGYVCEEMEAVKEKEMCVERVGEMWRGGKGKRRLWTWRYANRSRSLFSCVSRPIDLLISCARSHQHQSRRFMRGVHEKSLESPHASIYLYTMSDNLFCCTKMLLLIHHEFLILHSIKLSFKPIITFCYYYYLHNSLLAI